MRRVVLSLLLSACAPRAPRTVVPAAKASAVPVAAPQASRSAVHAVLLRRCGECHQGSRPTAVPAALQVFDLDQSDWPDRFDAARFEVALQRLGDEPASDRALFITFHRSAAPP